MLSLACGSICFLRSYPCWSWSHILYLLCVCQWLNICPWVCALQGMSIRVLVWQAGGDGGGVWGCCIVIAPTVCAPWHYHSGSGHHCPIPDTSDLCHLIWRVAGGQSEVWHTASEALPFSDHLIRICPGIGISALAPLPLPAKAQDRNKASWGTLGNSLLEHCISCWYMSFSMKSQNRAGSLPKRSLHLQYIVNFCIWR